MDKALARALVFSEESQWEYLLKKGIFRLGVYV